MLTRIAHFTVRAPRRILIAAAIVFVAAAAFGGTVASMLQSGGFVDPNAASTRADDLLAREFDTGEINLAVLVGATGGVESATARSTGLDVVTRLRATAGITEVQSYWTATGAAQTALRSHDGRAGLITARIAGDDDTATEVARTVASAAADTPLPAGVTIDVGGAALANGAVSDQVKSDLAKAELIAIPLTTIVLFWVFGSLVASLLPLVTGVFAIVGTLATLRVVASLTDVSIFAMNLTTALGLALAIDYSLLLINRYREEVQAGRSREDAITRTVQTAGRTVLFSALTVALSLAALLVFPLYFLTSFAYAGIAVVALAAVAALIVVPALLAVFGARVDSLDVRRPLRRLLRRPAPRPVPVTESGWYRLAGVVMRRAVPIGLAVIAVLLVLGAPFLGVRFGSPDDRVLPTSNSVRAVGDTVREQFDGTAAGAVTVVIPDRSGVSDTELGRFAAALSTLPHVTAVVASTGAYAGGTEVAPAPSGLTMATDDAAFLRVYNDVVPFSDAGTQVLEDVRSTTAPAPVLLTGPAARNADSLDALGARLPLAIGLIVVATFVVLFMFTGSLLMPLKAIVLNALSLTATFGAMVWVFQDGHLLGSVFDSTSTGYLVATMPILMFCIAFGMSMDYEVFLLSRIREAWLASDRSQDANTRAVQLGLARTGRIVTAAAALMAIVFAAMATSKVSFMQMFGLGLTLAVLMDATLVRGLLAPAFMRVAGRANWWAPAPLARWHARRGWSEDGAPEPAAGGGMDGAIDGEVRARRPDLVETA